MTNSSSAGVNKNKDRVAEIRKPKRLQVKIEEETYWRLRSAAARRQQMGVGPIVEAALRAWLETDESAKRTKP